MRTAPPSLYDKKEFRAIYSRTNIGFRDALEVRRTPDRVGAHQVLGSPSQFPERKQ